LVAPFPSCAFSGKRPDTHHARSFTFTIVSSRTPNCGVPESRIISSPAKVGANCSDRNLLIDSADAAEAPELIRILTNNPQPVAMMLCQFQSLPHEFYRASHSQLSKTQCRELSKRDFALGHQVRRNRNCE